MVLSEALQLMSSFAQGDEGRLPAGRVIADWESLAELRDTI